MITRTLLLCLVGMLLRADFLGAADAKPEIAVGYSFLRDQEIDTTFALGWNAAVGLPVNENVSVVGDVSGHYKSVDLGVGSLDLNVYGFFGGVRYVYRENEKVRPFVQGLGGLARASAGFLGASGSASDFAIQPGGGVDVPISEKVDFRAQIDWRIIFSDATTSEFRFVFGAVFALK